MATLSTDPATAAVVALVAVIKAIIAMLVAVAVAVAVAASVTLSSWDIHSGTLKMICVERCTFLISWCFWRCVLYFRVVYKIKAFVLPISNSYKN